jgi:hypothetical protein
MSRGSFVENVAALVVFGGSIAITLVVGTIAIFWRRPRR